MFGVAVEWIRRRWSMAGGGVRGKRMWSRAGDVVRLREFRGEGWSWLDNAVLLDYGREVGLYGLAVYWVLAIHVSEKTQTCTVSIRSFGRLLGIGNKRLNQAVANLEEAGLVRVERRPGYANRYTLLPVKRREGGDGA